jgi:hypothetical protein
VITSGGKRNPAKLDLSAGIRRERRRIDQACLILLSTDATAPAGDFEADLAAQLAPYSDGGMLAETVRYSYDLPRRTA